MLQFNFVVAKAVLNFIYFKYSRVLEVTLYLRYSKGVGALDLDKSSVYCNVCDWR